MANYFGMGGSFRAKKQAEEVDPMSSMGNMGDIMLVFACGLMVALVVAWNVDLKDFQQFEESETQEIEDVQENIDQFGEGGAGFVEKGTVWQDPKTGKYYLIEDTDKK